LRLVLLALYGHAVLTGFSSARSAERTPIDTLLTFTLAVALGSWAVADSRARRRPIPLLARPWFFIFAGVLVPAYVVWTRGWRGAVWVAAHVVGWFVVALIALVAAVVVIGDWGW
jgi:hypothetical protein